MTTVSTNAAEFAAGTDPTNDDSDGDDLIDGEELNTYNTDPNDEDSDDDGLTDGEEVNPTAPIEANRPQRRRQRRRHPYRWGRSERSRHESQRGRY